MQAYEVVSPQGEIMTYLKASDTTTNSYKAKQTLNEIRQKVGSIRNKIRANVMEF